jgi:putative PIN family toxin of toxin-antitoxin system
LEITLLVSRQTFAEYERVMFRSKFDRYVSLARRQTFLAELQSVVELVPIVELIMDCRDAKDNIYLEVAVNGLADVLIMGDQEL